MHPQRPLIGIVLDWAGGEDDYSRQPHYALGARYSAAVTQAGGLPVALPHHPELIPIWLEQLQGLIVPGGDYPFPQDWYADGHGSPYQTVRSQRVDFDATLMQAALQSDLPVLGICAGMQILGALHGCRLHGDLSGGTIAHRQSALPGRPAHGVSVTPASLLAQLGGAGEWTVNSVHNEAVAEITDRVRVSAQAPDGVIEAIEIPGQRFALGVQWHPEWLAEVGSPHAALFQGLVAASRGV